MFIVYLISIFLLRFSNENKDWVYEKTKNIYCSNSCKFNISSNHPFSPKIPTDIPEFDLRIWALEDPSEYKKYITTVEREVRKSFGGYPQQP